jgi:hypothetical protein
MLFKNSVRTSKRTPHFTITMINWLTLFKFNQPVSLVATWGFRYKNSLETVVLLLWVVTLCVLVGRYTCFRGTKRFHLQGTSARTSQPRRSASCLLPWEPQISNRICARLRSLRRCECRPWGWRQATRCRNPHYSNQVFLTNNWAGWIQSTTKCKCLWSTLILSFPIPFNVPSDLFSSWSSTKTFHVYFHFCYYPCYLIIFTS